MPANAVIRARIDEDVKKEATAILGAVGLTVSDAFRMMMMRTVAERALPFDPLIPNETTIAAMKEDASKLPTFDTVEALLDDLHAED